MNLSRREILKMLGAVALAPTYLPLFSMQNSGNPDYFNRVMKAKKGNWMKLPMNELMEKIAFEFIDVPYIGGTLDISDTEKCTVLLDKLDCVTYFETVLALARSWRAYKFDFEDIVKQVQFTRYRNGEIKDYTSRLHYTSDWIYENTQNRVVRDITKELGGEKINFNVGFMSQNHDKYRILKLHPEYIPIIKKQEEAINSRSYYYIPKEKIGKKIPGIQTCDIIAIASSIKGLDYAHIGFAYVNEDDEVEFLHASSTKEKVLLDTYLSRYLNRNKKQTGITVLRAI